MTLILPLSVFIVQKVGKCIDGGAHDRVIDKLEAELVLDLVYLVDILVQQVTELDQVNHCHVLHILDRQRIKTLLKLFDP